MNEKGKRWFQARLRWAVMEEGRGLDHWLEAEHIFQSDSREAAFAEALRIGHSQEYVVVPDRGRVTTLEHRLAEVVYLEEKVRNRWPSRYPSGGSRRPSRSASSTNSTPRNGCRNRLSDRLFSVAPAYARPNAPQRRQRWASLRPAPPKTAKGWGGKNWLVPQGGQI